ncbi:MAG: T9SS type A sorting domain-containing protein [Bacteroidales bacterium]|nr:MAG: T9SS type A sorting domain-containing protein [Bacteroidales bacterium]
MKTQLIKKSLSGILVIILFISSMLSLSGQGIDILKGGNMGESDEAFWTVEIVGRGDFQDPVGDQIPEYEFGYQEECLYCEGEVLRVWAAGTGYVNIIFSQEVTLKAGSTYKADGAFRDLTGGALNQFWAQLKIAIEGNPPSFENEDIKLMGFNTYLDPPCGPYIDGTWAYDACDWYGLNDEVPDLVGGIGFVAPDTLGEEFTAYFAIVIGMYTDGAVAYPYDIIIDNVSFIDSAAVSQIEPREFNNEMSLLNYPNPFNQETKIAYSIPERSYVRLSVYNLLGEKITSLYEGMKEAGSYEIVFDASNIKSNVLICRLEFNNRVINRKMTLIK